MRGIGATGGAEIVTAAQKTESKGTLEVRLFGTFDVRINDQPMPPLRYRKEQWLLALLVLRHDRDIPRDWLAATFWADSTESQALFYLRKSLSNLRKALGSEACRLQSPSTRTIRFDLSGAFADAVVFDQAVAGTLQGEDVESRLLEAVNLYQAPLLQDCMEEWTEPEREARAQSYLAALESLAGFAAARGDSVAAVRWLRLLLAADPYREHAYCALMQTLANSGDMAAVTQVYRELRLRLRSDLNVAPAPETEHLYRELTERELPHPAELSSPVHKTPLLRHLPVPLTDLIGREQEREEIAGWLHRCRLVTLIGPGGVGKTRLSIAVADAVLPSFAEGVWFVDFAGLTEPALIPQAVIQALYLSTEGGQQSLNSLVNALTGRSLLLVLDNCEHLIEACANLAHCLLTRCANLRILATSRQALGVTGEQNYFVTSLELPPLESAAIQEKDPFALLAYPSMRLFVERATQANPAFRLNRKNAETIVQICHQLDGIPLALEMGAARIRSLSVQEISTRLEDRFRLLTTGSRAAMPRHQTLRATIDWSHDLLLEAERILLRRLAVFAGSWTLAEAEAVCGEGMETVQSPALEAEEIFERVSCLAEKSLVQTSDDHGQVRYRLLETVREYAKERLAESGEEEAVCRRHSLAYLQLAAESSLLFRTEPDKALAQLERENDNFRAALDFCEHTDIETGMRLAAALCSFWLARGYFQEGRQRCAFFLTHPAAQDFTRLRAVLLCGTCSLAYHQRDDVQARAYAEEALALFVELNDPEGIAEAQLQRAFGMKSDDPQQAECLYTECLEAWRAMKNPGREAVTLESLAQLARDQGDYSKARPLYDQSLALYKRLGAKQSIAVNFHSIAYTDYMQQRFPSALSAAEEALRISEETGNQTWKLYHLALLGWVCLALGDEAKTQAYCEASVRMLQKLGLKAHIAGALECLACLAQLQQQDKRGACLAGAADVIRTSLGVAMDSSILPDYRARLSQMETALGHDAFTDAWERGSAMTPEQALMFASQNCPAK